MQVVAADEARPRHTVSPPPPWWRSSWRSSLRGRLAALFVLALVPALAASVVTSLDERARLRNEAGETATRLSRLLAAHLEGMLTSTYELLRVLDEHPAVVAVAAGCEQTFDHILASASTTYSGFAVADKNGTIVCSSPKALRRVDISGRSIFQRLVNGADFSVGQTQVGDLSGKTVVLASHAIRPGAALDGVVIAGVDLTSLSGLASRINLPPGATFTILSGEGDVIARYPDPAAWIGRSTVDSPVTQQLLNASAVGAFEARGLDQQRRIFGFAPLQAGGTRFFIVVALLADDLTVPADRVLYRNLAGLGLGALVAFGLVAAASESWLRRPVARMLETANRIKSGDLAARVAMDDAAGELGPLAKGIDDMAAGLQRREREVAALSRRVLDVQESERRAIARELHDEIGQSVTAIKLMLQAHRRAGATATAWLDDSMVVTDRVLQQVRSMSLNLRPAMLDHLGLGATLRWYVHEESARTGLSIQCEVEPPDLRLDDHHETALFRIAQEALTNVVRHASASSVSVALVAKDGVIDLTVRDNGGGFDVAAARERACTGASLGILGMEERATLVGAVFDIRSTPSGTEVHVRIGAPDRRRG